MTKKFLENDRLLDGRFLLEKRGIRPPLGDNGLPVEGYRYSFRGPVKQCRLCAHCRPSNMRANSSGVSLYHGAFNCTVKDFNSSSGYVVALNCDSWQLSDDAPSKNRGQAWLYMRPVKDRRVD